MIRRVTTNKNPLFAQRGWFIRRWQQVTVFFLWTVFQDLLDAFFVFRDSRITNGQLKQLVLIWFFSRTNWFLVFSLGYSLDYFFFVDTKLILQKSLRKVLRWTGRFIRLKTAFYGWVIRGKVLIIKALVFTLRKG